MNFRRRRWRRQASGIWYRDHERYVGPHAAAKSIHVPMRGHAMIGLKRAKSHRLAEGRCTRVAARGRAGGA